MLELKNVKKSFKTGDFVQQALKGINLNFAVVSEAVSCLRTGKQLKADWKKKIDEDYKNRKK